MDCSKLDIVAIKLPYKLIKDNDKYQALEVAEKIMIHNKQDKKARDVIATWHYYIVCYDTLNNLKKFSSKALKFKNGITIYTSDI